MTTTPNPQRARAIARFRLIGLVIPLAAFAAMALVQLAMIPWMPDPIAIHWGLTGGPDGFGPAWSTPILTVVVGGGLTALLAGLTLAEITSPGKRVAYRFMAAVIWWELGMLGMAVFGTYVVQLGLDDARQAPSVGFLLASGVVLGVVLGFVGWKLAIEPPSDEEEASTPAAVTLGANERAVWMRTVTMARSGIVVLVVAIVVVLAATVGSFAAELAAGAPLMGAWISLAALILVTVSILCALVFRVRVDEDGLEVRAAAGWPRIRIARDDIRSVEVVHVSPMGEYGGWGWRYGIGSGWAVVMRTGEAIRVTRRNGKVFTVTVDDAETGAALLRGLADRDRSRGGGAREDAS